MPAPPACTNEGTPALGRSPPPLRFGRLHASLDPNDGDQGTVQKPATTLHPITSTGSSSSSTLSHPSVPVRPTPTATQPAASTLRGALGAEGGGPSTLNPSADPSADCSAVAPDKDADTDATDAAHVAPSMPDAPADSPPMGAVAVPIPRPVRCASASSASSACASVGSAAASAGAGVAGGLGSAGGLSRLGARPRPPLLAASGAAPLATPAAPASSAASSTGLSLRRPLFSNLSRPSQTHEPPPETPPETQQPRPPETQQPQPPEPHHAQAPEDARREVRDEVEEGAQPHVQLAETIRTQLSAPQRLALHVAGQQPQAQPQLRMPSMQTSTLVLSRSTTFSSNGAPPNRPHGIQLSSHQHPPPPSQVAAPAQLAPPAPRPLQPLLPPTVQLRVADGFSCPPLAAKPCSSSQLPAVGPDSRLRPPRPRIGGVTEPSRFPSPIITGLSSRPATVLVRTRSAADLSGDGGGSVDAGVAAPAHDPHTPPRPTASSELSAAPGLAAQRDPSRMHAQLDERGASAAQEVGGGSDGGGHGDGMEVDFEAGGGATTALQSPLAGHSRFELQLTPESKGSKELKQQERLPPPPRPHPAPTTTPTPDVASPHSPRRWSTRRGSSCQLCST